MKKLYITLLLLAAFCPLAQAQRVKVYVTDTWSRPLGEVAVGLEGKNGPAAVTDADGVAEIDAATGDRITLNLFNRLRRTVRVSSREMHVRLTDDDRLFDLGYDEKVRKGSTTAALSGASAEQIGAGGRTDLLSNLYGLIPGLGVRQSENLPWDQTPTLNVRGTGSFGGNSVVVLVDGIERDASYLDREEIESVTVLKDAASLALYGNRGADGVVSITTKRGGNHALRTRIDYNFGVQTPFRTPAMADAATYAEAVNEALANDGLAARYTQRDIRAMVGGARTDVLPNVDWRKAVLRNTGFSHDLNLTFDGNSDRMRYFVLANYNSNRGFLNNTDLNDGYSTQVELYALKLRSNLEAALTRTTTARINLMGRLMQYQQPNAGTSLGDMYDTPAAAFPVRTPTGGWSRSQLFTNPLADKTSRGYNTVLQRTLLADLTVDQDLSMLTEGLSAQVRVAYDNSAEITDARSRNYAYSNVSPVQDGNGNVESLAYAPQGNNTELAFDSYLSFSVMRASVWAKIGYDRSFGRHHVTGRLIFSENKSRYRGANNTYMYRDYIASAGYNYDDRYLLDAVATYGGSSRMPRGDKFRFYPAVAGAWIVSNEAFLRGSGVVDLLKLRASFGVAGMDSRLSYDMDKQFNGAGNSYIFVGISPMNGLAQGALPSTGIEPERDYKTNVGLEIGLLKGLEIEIDFFHNIRRHIRTSSAATVSGVLGVGAPDIFTGKVRNYGGELALGWRRQAGDFGYAVRGNVAYARNKILNKEEGYKPYDYMRITGHPSGTFYGLVADGLYQEADFDAAGALRPGLPASSYKSSLQPGDVKYRDLNGDGTIDDYDRTYQLHALLPEIYYGFSVELKYRNFGISAYFQGAARSTLTTTLASIYQPLYGNDRNISEHYMANRWSQFDTDGRYPRLTTQSNDNNYTASSLWTENGNFLKLRTLQAVYKLPAKIARKLRMRECGFYFRGLNLFSADCADILDPEYISTGYPSARSYQIGLNVIF